MPDFVLREGPDLYVVEVTASAVRPADAVCCDVDQLQRALERVWVGGDDTSAKLVQLQRVWSAARGRSLDVPGLAIGTVENVWPILVSLRYVPQNPAIWAWFGEILRAKQFDNEFIDSLVIMDAEDWEEWCYVRLRGERWADWFARWRGSRWAKWGFYTFCNAELGVRTRHPVAERWLDDLWANMGKTLNMPLAKPSDRKLRPGGGDA